MLDTRRQFLGRASGLAVTVVVPPALMAAAAQGASRQYPGGRFPDGVIAGDPTADGVNLWTRVDPRGAASSGWVTLEIATDKGFRKVVARKRIATNAANNHAVKALVRGLKAREEYYYRFATRTSSSAVGRFRTLPPAGSQEPIRFAFWSCQEYSHGYYNAHTVMAKGDYDFVVCLGDYIYAETYSSTKNGKGVRNDPIGRTNPTNPDIMREAVTLADYRAKYSLYRSDPSLQAVHRKFPMVMLWDDHEVQDNWAGGAAGGGLAAGKRFSAARRAAATKAFFESNPAFAGATRKRLYRSIPFGGTVELIAMDQRSYRQDQPCGDAVVAPCADYDQPRTLLGRTQLDWVKSRLAASTATWKILANEVTIMPTRVLGGANFTYDTWIGYPREREELLTFIRDRQIKDVVFVTGDIHTFIAGDVKTGDGVTGDTVATEFVGGSVTSQSLGEIDLDAGGGNVIKGNDANPNTPTAIIDALRGINPQVDQADFDHHGFGVIDARSDGLTCSLVRVETIKKKTTKLLPADAWTYQVARGQPSIKGQHGPAAV